MRGSILVAGLGTLKKENLSRSYDVVMVVPHNASIFVFPHDDGWGYRVHCPGCEKILEEGVRQSEADAWAAATTVAGQHKVSDS